jgi:hypothetical protein
LWYKKERLLRNQLLQEKDPQKGLSLAGNMMGRAKAKRIMMRCGILSDI